jgi:hypothetical protein
MMAATVSSLPEVSSLPPEGGGGVVASFLKVSSCETSALRLCCTRDVRLAVMCLCPFIPEHFSGRAGFGPERKNPVISG